MIRTRRNLYPQTRAIWRLSGQVASLGAGAGPINSRITSLEGEVSTLEGEVSTLESQVSTLEGEISTLEGQVNTLADEVAQARAGAVPVGGGMFCFDLTHFNQATGLGSGPFARYALCDGRNGCPDLRGLFLVGYDAGQPDYDTVGNSGGAAAVTLIVPQLAAHTHALGVRSNGASSDFSGNFHPAVSQNQTDASSNGYETLTEARGGNEAHENRPPFYTAAYIMRIQ